MKLASMKAILNWGRKLDVGGGGAPWEGPLMFSQAAYANASLEFCLSEHMVFYES